jgi:hypothetical protein
MRLPGARVIGTRRLDDEAKAQRRTRRLVNQHRVACMQLKCIAGPILRHGTRPPPTPPVRPSLVGGAGCLGGH